MNHREYYQAFEQYRQIEQHKHTANDRRPLTCYARNCNERAQHIDWAGWLWCDYHVTDRADGHYRKAA